MALSEHGRLKSALDWHRVGLGLPLLRRNVALRLVPVNSLQEVAPRCLGVVSPVDFRGELGGFRNNPAVPPFLPPDLQGVLPGEEFMEVLLGLILRRSGGGGGVSLR